MNNRTVIGSSVIPLRLVFLMWLCFFLERTYSPGIGHFGISPRTVEGLVGIFVSPMIHGDILHLVSNSIPLLFLGSLLFYFYRPIATNVFLRAYFWTNILVWLFARPANHIGASGVVYALAFFLIFFGLFRRDFQSILITLVTVTLYGSVFYGILPGDPVISWESHFGGALVGIASAITFSAKKKVS